MEEIMGQVKWTITNHNKGWPLFKEGDAVYMVDWKGVLYYTLLLENQTIISNKYCLFQQVLLSTEAALN